MEAYLASLFGMLISALAAVSLFKAVDHFDKS